MRNFIVFLCFIVGGIHTIFAQSGKLKAMEDDLVFIQNTAARFWVNMFNFDNNKGNGDFDTYTNYHDTINLLCRQFDSMLNQMLVEDKDMTYPFTKLQMQKGHLLDTYIVWSNDSLLRVFSWFLPSGTMHFYGNAVQYKNPNSIVCSFSFENNYNKNYEVNQTGYNYDTVYILKEENKTIYILSGSTQGQTMYPIYQLTAYNIEDGFTSKNIFQNKNGNIINEINVGYDISCSNINGNNFPRPIIDEEKKTMNLLEINDSCFTGKFIKYEFDGKKFKLDSKM